MTADLRKSLQAKSHVCRALRPAGVPPRLGAATPRAQDVIHGGAEVRNLVDSAMVVLDDERAWQELRCCRFAELPPGDPECVTQRAAPPPADAVASTVAFGRFPTPVNCAEPSPDGAWIAVLTDTMHVVLLPEALDYCMAAGALVELDSTLKRCASPSTLCSVAVRPPCSRPVRSDCNDPPETERPQSTCARTG